MALTSFAASAERHRRGNSGVPGQAGRRAQRAAEYRPALKARAENTVTARPRI